MSTEDKDDAFKGTFTETLVLGVVSLAIIVAIGWGFFWLLKGAIGPYL